MNEREFTEFSSKFLNEVNCDLNSPEESTELNIDLSNLNLNDVQLQNILNKIDDVTASKVVRMDLRGNSIKSIRFEPGRFPELKEINLSNNKITELHDSLRYLIALEKLHLANNLLNKWPRVIEEMCPSNDGKLTYLDMRYNSVIFTPNELSGLKLKDFELIIDESSTTNDLTDLSNLRAKGVIIYKGSSPYPDTMKPVMTRHYGVHTKDAKYKRVGTHFGMIGHPVFKKPKKSSAARRQKLGS